MDHYRQKIYNRIVRQPSGCWEWRGAHNRAGYAYCNYPRSGTIALQGAHRVVYELERGDIPAKMDLDHLCRNPGCVNPDHLEPVTRSENTRRGHSPELTRQRMLGNELWRYKRRGPEVTT